MSTIKLLIYTPQSKRGNGQHAIKLPNKSQLYKVNIDDLQPILTESISMAMAMTNQETFTLSVSEWRLNELNLFN